LEVGFPLSASAEERKIYTLSQLGESLKRTLEQVTQGRALWFKAEISKITSSPSGHVYLDLVEEVDGQRLAVMRGTLWKSQHAVVREALGDAADHVLAAGSEIVFSGRVNYHPVYGVSLVLEEIDLSAMIGEAERRKQATLATLKAQGALEWNRAVPLPRLVQRVALVGSPGTSGFRDFGMHLLRNEWGVGFDVEVFPATVQGKEAPPALMAALERAQAWNPDAVVVVRGGGSALDLDAFNDLDLCLAIANCPRPVLTGIGHETDLSVADLVAHRHFKTPTAVADFLVDRLVTERSRLAEMSLAMGQRVQQRLTWERERFAQDLQTLKLQPRQLLAAEALRLSHAREQVTSWAKQALEKHVQRMAHLASTVDALNPDKTLQRGFAVARKDGKAVRDVADLALNDVLNLRFHKGHADVTVTRVTSDPDE
jgi:exodeoxyribonuclease VII large subunit